MSPVAAVTRVAVIGNYLPRQCGIATFTTHLCEAMAAARGDDVCFAVPVNDRASGYAYPPRVRFEIAEHDLASYRRAADFLNISNVDVACLQHEYGIFGGPYGSHILALLGELRMPVVTTLHTVLERPDPGQRRVLEAIAERSDRLVVMSRRAIEFLERIYGVPRSKIELIPHGIPDVPFIDPNFYKDQFGVQGKTVLLTFGLISRNKGIEHVIEALPDVLARAPDVVYVVLGATHPHVRQVDGEAYRLSLERRARERRVERHVIFQNRFVSQEELVEFIGAADIHITPYLNREQIVSGTLAYTVGAGKAVVATPYWYAEEILDEGRGVLVPFGDSAAIASRVINLVEHEAERHAMRKRAYLYGREMIWATVARRYLEVFACVREERAVHPRPVFEARTLGHRDGELPELTLDHLRAMTDDTGLLQHAVYTVPNYTEGYTTDDNARALILAVLLEGTGQPDRLASRYLAFLWHAFNPAPRRFRNHLSYDRRWLEDAGPEDAHGRAVGALGFVLGRSDEAGVRGPASRLFEPALGPLAGFTSPRAWAAALIGLHEYRRRFAGDRIAHQLEVELAERLLALYRSAASAEWPWFEPVLAYGNATLPHALLVAGEDLQRVEMVDTALRALEWLMDVQRPDGGHFVPVGSDGFYRRGGPRARFDQQPIEAQTTVSACLEAHRVTGEARWRDHATCAFEWFLGRNDLGLPLYDAATGGCRDGLHADRVNQNQGAESTVAYLTALAEMILATHVLDASRPGARGFTPPPVASLPASVVSHEPH